MARIENWNAEVRSWLSPFFDKLGHKAERSLNAGERMVSCKPNPSTLESVTIRPPVEVRAQLEIDATKRGITITELCSRLVCVAARDGLVGAVLDD